MVGNQVTVKSRINTQYQGFWPFPRLLWITKINAQIFTQLLLDFKSKRLAMISKDRALFQYNSRDLVYIVSPLRSQLCTAWRKVIIKYVGWVVIYKITDPHKYLLMTLDGKILRGLFEHERLKPSNVTTNQRVSKILHN